MIRPQWTRRRWLLVTLAVVLVTAAGVATWRWVHEDDTTRFEAALALAPKDAARLSWTDWSGVRRELGADIDADSTGEEVDGFLLKSYDRDLSGNTALEESASTIQDEMGFSPATIDWELFAQGDKGAIVLMGLPEDFDYRGLRETLRDVGFTEPEEENGVWFGGVDLLEGLSGPVTPELATLAIDEDAGVLYGSDQTSTLEDRAKRARGHREDGISDVVKTAGPALSAAAYVGSYTCAELSMAQASPADRTRAAELIEAAGGVHPLTGYAIAAQPGGHVLVAMALETPEQARSDADSRRDLASGPAPGQGGTFTERFTLDEVSAADRVIRMDLSPVEGWQVVSDLNQGPVLFATC
ncbi:MAG: hypothetical protein L0H31_05260 [Nocardioidaceae bacterium]|nr:hypothetical protein [Nocardioidaceae bacterium]